METSVSSGQPPGSEGEKGWFCELHVHVILLWVYAFCKALGSDLGVIGGFSTPAISTRTEFRVHLFIRLSCLALPNIFGFDSAS